MKSPTPKSLTKQPTPYPLPAEREQAVTLSYLLESNKLTIASLLPPGTPVERYLWAAKQAYDRNEQLRKCTPQSIYGAILQSAYLGLEIGQGNQAHLVPYWSSKLQAYEARFQVGYQGLRRLGRLYGDVLDDDAGVICEADEVEFELGPHASFRLKHSLVDRGEVVAYYCWAQPKQGSLKIAIMSKAEVESHMHKTAKRDKDGRSMISDAWRQHFDEMAIKTCVRRCYKYLAQEPRLLRAIELDEQAEADISQHLDASVHAADVSRAREHNQRAIETVKHANLNKDHTEPKKEEESVNEGAASAQPPADVSETDAPPSVAPSPSPTPDAEAASRTIDESMVMDAITVLRDATTPKELNDAYRALPDDLRRKTYDVYSDAMAAFKRGGKP